MKIQALTIPALAIIGFATAGTLPAGAHHSYDAEFDRNQPVHLEGTVNRLEWKNPHAYLYVDVATDGEETETWALQLGGPPALAGRLGWTRETVASGDAVSIDGYLAREGDLWGVAREVTLASGETLQATIGLQEGRGGPRGGPGFGRRGRGGF